ncbi:hypothetical protein FAM09_05955 [Niastella caeni]|uniref:Outer membrane protein beta-barrel domain-containing protein n=1 Tax=Niastella caeni TaxID=2569763 RepID=A0A4S8I0Z9_9BACT|nr:hypothetical protein [Niastella caeni]THU41640.1 hypothetical protein FAM09_05955 [Niastella caeni]
MNFKHPYEKHLAEKLVQLPPPDDPDQNWQQMKVLLDKNMPRGGGGPGGSYRWWIAGAIIVAVVVGTWFGGKTFLNREPRNVAGTIKTVNNKTAPSVALTDKNAGQKSASKTTTPAAGGNTEVNNNLPGAAYASSTSTPDNSTSAASGLQQPATGNDAVDKNIIAPENKGAVTNNSAKNDALTLEEAEKARSSGNNVNTPPLLTANDNNKETNETPTSYHNKTTVDRNKIYTPDSKNDNKRTGNNGTTNNRTKAIGTLNNNDNAGNVTGIQPDDENAVVSNTANNRVKNKKGKKPVRKAAANVNKPAQEEPSATRYTYKPTITLPTQPSAGSGLKESPVAINVNYTGSSVVAPSGVVQREFTYYTQADLFPEMVAKKKTAKRKSAWSTHSQEDKTFAFGFSLPLGFPVGDQQPLAYNRNAGVNTISDYIPSPHFQYHFNSKTYMQAGLQFSQPQFIRPVLLYQDQRFYSQGPSWIEQTTSISARKLYYFNVPLTIYHSPLRNFYMGTGLQFSSLLSGVAHYEKVERRTSQMGPPQEYVIKNYFTKFRNDSLSSRLNGNEVRLLIDMSYYWSRFTVGLQYNQAFNNYVSFQVNPSAPYTFDKNKSLQFYLRYNIWEDKKRKQSKDKPMLTLK